MAHTTVAFCYRNGVIHFGSRVPDGALSIASSANGKLLREKVKVAARWSYPTKRGGKDSKPLVPGVPEAPDDVAACDAVIRFSKEVRKRLEKGGK